MQGRGRDGSTGTGTSGRVEAGTRQGRTGTGTSDRDKAGTRQGRGRDEAGTGRQGRDMQECRDEAETGS